LILYACHKLKYSLHTEVFMNFFICPICKKHFSRREHSLVCPDGHCFDIAKQGYVNLLRNKGSSARRHGDDKIMIASRTSFLNAGFYNPLRDAVAELVIRHAKNSGVVLDAGCGEGFYTSFIRNSLEDMGVHASVCGIDVSRDAVIACAARDRHIGLAVASISDLPAEDGSVDILINLFAPYDAAEFARVLKPGGILIRAFPGERHLWELKTAIYESPYENVIDTLELPDFTLCSRNNLHFPLSLTDGEQIEALFKMTPYYYKTSREGQAKLAALQKLHTNAEFIIAHYQKRGL